MVNEELKKWIDDASYYQLLERNRFAPDGDIIFQGGAGAYFIEVMAEKKAKLSHGARVATSKAVGWDR